MEGKNKRILYCSPTFQNLIRKTLKLVFNNYFNVNVHGKENIPKKGSLIFSCNHTNNLDPLILAGQTKRINYAMSKKELFFPGLKNILVKLGAYPVETKPTKKGYKDLTENYGLLIPKRNHDNFLKEINQYLSKEDKLDNLSTLDHKLFTEYILNTEEGLIMFLPGTRFKSYDKIEYPKKGAAWNAFEMYEKYKTEANRMSNEVWKIELGSNKELEKELDRKFDEQKNNIFFLQKIKIAFKLKKIPKTIEIYDISHISGEFAVGAMVSFNKDGFIKNNYRKFNIKGKFKRKDVISKGDDYSMIYEVVNRRLKKSSKTISFPDLMIIDGGKGHFNTALNALKKRGEDPFAQVAQVVYLYLKDRFFLASEHLDPLSVDQALIGIIEAKALANLVDLLKLCDAGRYGPEAADAEETLIEEAKNILRKVDSSK